MALEEIQVISIAPDLLIRCCGATDSETRINHDCMIWTASLTKMKFLVQKATFIAYGITTDGLQPNPVTVQVTVSMPTPTDKQVVHRFLETINFLSKFCPQLGSITLATSMEPDQRGHTILVANTTPRSIYWSKKTLSPPLDAWQTRTSKHWRSFK